ncbi:PREDICTED: centrosomal protein of 63 kDa isoform X3 [Gavialis gangeticus]|uniref:centrosomal protein of 63 kDa isoform X3 n=1 Tax=Gavialis gangeticus TaxID=94835 RepID=UPI00092ED8A3|nr:PREDICTED: centrosomal protein of 63 kDa isoform X3 [Gavialis gangeticus]
MEALLEGMQKQGRGSRGFLTSCEAELHELMKQIDIMVARKKSEWEGQAQALEACLEVRDQELSSTRALLNEKHKEVGMLCQQLEGMEKAKQDMAVEYEQQLKTFQEELARLKRSYEKLQKKQLKEARENAKSQGHAQDQSEVTRLTKKIEEFRQKSLDWEKQRLLYQQQVASLEAQRKALAEQSELIQTQLSNRKQLLESVELASQSEIQHLTSQLQRANDTICANELEVERLNMRVDDLTETNQKILEEEQRVEEELRRSKKMLEVLKEEKTELRATLQSQEDFISSSKMHEEQLQKELARVTETLHTKEQLVRSLEDCLHGKRLSPQGAELERVLLRLDLAHKNEEHLQSEMARLESCLGSANERCIQLSEELTKRLKELRQMEEQHCQSKAEMKKLKEQLSRIEQTHNSELEGMKKEISQLTQELHQRDIVIASASGSTSDMEQQLRMEIERAERKAVEHRVILVQLETLRLENHHLSEMLKKVESGVSEAKDNPLRHLQESYAKALNTLESENQQLQRDLAEARAKLELSTQDSEDKDKNVVQQMSNKRIEIKDVECRGPQEPQHKYKEESRKLQANFDESSQHHKDELQGLKAQHLSAATGTASASAGGQSPPISRNSSLESVSSDSLPDVNKDFTDEASRESVSSRQRESVLLCPLPSSPVGSIAARFLEEEELRSQHILDRLDAHIEELKKESERTVKQFAHQE